MYAISSFGSDTSQNNMVHNATFEFWILILKWKSFCKPLYLSINALPQLLVVQRVGHQHGGFLTLHPKLG